MPAHEEGLGAGSESLVSAPERKLRRGSNEDDSKEQLILLWFVIHSITNTTLFS